MAEKQNKKYKKVNVLLRALASGVEQQSAWNSILSQGSLRRSWGMELLEQFTPCSSRWSSLTALHH